MNSFKKRGNVPSKDEEDKEKRRNLDELDWKDYIALTIALLETSLLPFVLLIIILLIVTLFIVHIF